MLIALIILAVVVTIALVIRFTRYRAEGRTPPEAEPEPTPSPPAGRNETWDPRHRYDHDGSPSR